MAKYGYLCFIKYTQKFLTSPDDWPAWGEKSKKVVEKHGFKMHFRGSPWGTDEHQVMVCSSDKSLDDWSQFIGEMLRNGNIATTRTVLVNIQE